MQSDAATPETQNNTQTTAGRALRLLLFSAQTRNAAAVITTDDPQGQGWDVGLTRRRHFNVGLLSPFGLDQARLFAFGDFGVYFFWAGKGWFSAE